MCFEIRVRIPCLVYNQQPLFRGSLQCCDTVVGLWEGHLAFKSRVFVCWQ